MRRRVLGVALGLGVTLAGCAGQDWSRNVYEALRQRQDAEKPAGAGGAALPDYDRYRREVRPAVDPAK